MNTPSQGFKGYATQALRVLCAVYCMRVHVATYRLSRVIGAVMRVLYIYDMNARVGIATLVR